jgi:hypothetical protein
MGSSSPSHRFKCQPATSKNDQRKRREAANEHPPAKNIQHDSTESLRALLRFTRLTKLRKILKIAAEGKSRIGFRQKMLLPMLVTWPCEQRMYYKNYLHS